MASATGRIDGMVFLGGFFVGLLAFFFSYDAVEPFYLSGERGRVLLPDALGVNPGVVVFAVVLIALGAFALTHVLDRKLAKGRAVS